MGKLCFSMFVLRKTDIYIVLWDFVFLYTCTWYVSVQRRQDILLIYLIGHFLF